MSDETIMTKGAMPHYVAALHFDMTTEDGREEHQLALDACKWKRIVTDAQQQVRSWIKYGNDFSSVDEALENVKSLLNRSPEDV